MPNLRQTANVSKSALNGRSSFRERGEVDVRFDKSRYCPLETANGFSPQFCQLQLCRFGVGMSSLMELVQDICCAQYMLGDQLLLGNQVLVHSGG